LSLVFGRNSRILAIFFADFLSISSQFPLNPFFVFCPFLISFVCFLFRFTWTVIIIEAFCLYFIFLFYNLFWGSLCMVKFSFWVFGFMFFVFWWGRVDPGPLYSLKFFILLKSFVVLVFLSRWFCLFFLVLLFFQIFLLLYEILILLLYIWFSVFLFSH
jgi:hypothetical protein